MRTLQGCRLITRAVRRSLVGAVVVALVATTQGCTRSHSAPNKVSSARPTPAMTGVDIASGCRHPTAIASTNRHIQVGKAGAPTIGPLSFHPYPYDAGYPTKMIIHAEVDQTQPLVLHGYRCTDGRTLRFSYDQDALPAQPPYTEHQLQTLGDVAETLKPIRAPYGDHLGYALFSSSGQWLITVTEGSTTLGMLRVDVSKPS